MPPGIPPSPGLNQAAVAAAAAAALQYPYMQLPGSLQLPSGLAGYANEFMNQVTIK